MKGIFATWLILMHMQQECRKKVNSLPNDKILDGSKLKAFADGKIKILKRVIFVIDRVENIVGKGENAGYQHFLLFPQCFQRVFYPWVLKFGIVR